ncbi:MAG: fibrobacter succinogenes major paralogous domain-containing protein [Bacteroidales bacterium]|nr:fibrobacter succinogenes major paralogous domain-containing protein [Bacteroidales bacterium]
MKRTIILQLIFLTMFFLTCETEKSEDNNTPDIELPKLATRRVNQLTADTAICGGRIFNDGGSMVTARGVCWSSTPVPAIDGNKTSDASDTGIYESCITGYDPDVTYYVRAYATNSLGTAYGNQVTFRYIPPSGVFSDPRDNHEYKWIRINNQVWMAENLAYLPAVSASAEISRTDPHYYVYAYDGNSVDEAKATSNYSTYGVLYNWPAAMNGAASDSSNPGSVQGACPCGWHLPSFAEWTELTDTLGGDSIAGSKLKEAGFAHWMSPNEGAENSSGFTALPGGYLHYQYAFIQMEQQGLWWSSTEDINAGFTWICRMWYGDKAAGCYYYRKENAVSIRCVRD